MNPFERAIRRVDGLQQRFGPAAYAYGVVKKFGDDRAGHLSALMAYYGFISLFPALLALVTLLGIVAGTDTSFTRQIRHSALAEFPVVGTQLGKNIGVMQQGNVLALAIGFLGLVWGSQGALQISQFAMAQVWNIPGIARPNFVSRWLRTLLMMVLIGVFFAVSTAAAGFSSFVHTVPVIAEVGTIALSATLNLALYAVAFRVLTPKVVPSRCLLLGAAVGASGWTVLQIFGAMLVEHNLRGASHLYGFFGVVLGLLAWIYLGAELTMYAAEINVVTVRRLWPRSLIQPPLTDADKRVLAAISHQERRRPEQQVSVRFDGAGDAAPQADEAGTEADEAGTEAGQADEAAPRADTAGEAVTEAPSRATTPRVR